MPNNDDHELDGLRNMLEAIGYSLELTDTSDDEWAHIRAVRQPRAAHAAASKPPK